MTKDSRPLERCFTVRFCCIVDILGMKIIKLRALEEFFETLITAIRDRQLKALRGYYSIQVFFVAFLQITPVAMPIVAFITYADMNNSLTPQIIFPALALFNILFQPLLVLPTSVSQLVVAIVSWGRIREFLLAEEMPKHAHFETADCSVSIRIKEASFQWEAEIKTPLEQELKKKEMKQIGKTEPESLAQEYAIRNMSLQIKKGELVAVVGAVGSGKSSLLSAIIGEMPRVSGEVGFCSSVDI